MDCLNFRKVENIYKFDSADFENFKGNGKRIINYLPAYSNIDVEILMPDATKISGLGEHNIKSISVGDVIQFERFGFCRLDEIETKNKKTIYKFWFTHK